MTSARSSACTVVCSGFGLNAFGRPRPLFPALPLGTSRE